MAAGAAAIANYAQAGAAVAGATTPIIADIYNVHEGRKTRRFQREAAMNSVKWRMDDLRQSGINPLLAAGSSAAQPSASTPTVQGKIDLAQNLMNYRMTKANLKQINEAINTQKTQQEVNTAAVGKMLEEQAKANEEWQTEQERRKYIKSQTRLADSMATRNMLDFAEAQANSKMWQDFGKKGKMASWISNEVKNLLLGAGTSVGAGLMGAGMLKNRLMLKVPKKPYTRY